MNILEDLKQFHLNNKDAKFNDYRCFKTFLNIRKEELNLLSIPETIFFICNNLDVVPKCLICGNRARFKNIQEGYSKTCCMTCTRKTDEFRENLSTSLKNSEKAKAQRIEFAKAGAAGLKRKMDLKTEEERKEIYKNQQLHREAAFEKKYGEGVTNPMYIKAVREENHKAMRNTNIESGRWLNFDIIEDLFKQYCKKVEYVTFKQNFISLENFDKRGHVILEDSYHLDHMISKKAGFVNNIPPYIIGSIHNLQMIRSRENLSKQEKCSQSLDDLFKRFFGDF